MESWCTDGDRPYPLMFSTPMMVTRDKWGGETTTNVRWYLTWEARNSSHSGELHSPARTSLTCARDSIPGGQTWVQNCTRQMSCWFQKEGTAPSQRSRGPCPQPQSWNMLSQNHSTFTRFRILLICMSCICFERQSNSRWRVKQVPEILHALSQPL